MGVTQWWRRLTGKQGAGAGAPAWGGAQARGKGSGKVGGRSAAKPGAGAQPRPARAGATAPTARPGRQAAVDPAQPVLGLVAGRSGWVGASLEASGHGTPHIVAGSSLADVVAQAGPVTVVAVNVPVGLPDDSRRAADAELRRLLGPQSSAVVRSEERTLNCSHVSISY